MSGVYIVHVDHFLPHPLTLENNPKSCNFKAFYPAFMQFSTFFSLPPSNIFFLLNLHFPLKTSFSFFPTAAIHQPPSTTTVFCIIYIPGFSDVFTCLNYLNYRKHAALEERNAQNQNQIGQLQRKSY